MEQVPRPAWLDPAFFAGASRAEAARGERLRWRLHRAGVGYRRFFAEATREAGGRGRGGKARARRGAGLKAPQAVVEYGFCDFYAVNRVVIESLVVAKRMIPI